MNNVIEKAQQLAQNVSKFIAHNNIDTTQFTLEEIVQGYFETQLQAAETAGEELLKKL